MIHAISEFYGLTSFSKDNQDGGRDTVVFKKADYDVGALPESSSLSSFLVCFNFLLLLIQRSSLLTQRIMISTGKNMKR